MSDDDGFADLYEGKKYQVRITRRQHGTEVEVEAVNVEVAVGAYLDTCNLIGQAQGYAGPKKGSPQQMGERIKANRQVRAIQYHTNKRSKKS